MLLQSTRTARGCVALALGLGLLACSVDDRELVLRSAAGGAAAGGPNARAGGNSGPSEGGEASPMAEGGSAGAGVEVPAAGAGSTPSDLPPLVGGCADLDTDQVADCSVTLVKNASFATDVSSWTAVSGGSLAWNGSNALDDTPSGCAQLTAQGSSDLDGSALYRASQCVPVAAGQLVVAYANARVEASAGSTQAAHALLDVSYFDAEDCTGTSTGHFVTPPHAAGNAWGTIQAGGVTEAATRAVLVELVGIKPFRANSLSVCFDNVMVKTKAL